MDGEMYCTILINSSGDKLDERKIPSISDGTRDICPNPAIVIASMWFYYDFRELIVDRTKYVH